MLYEVRKEAYIVSITNYQKFTKLTMFSHDIEMGCGDGGCHPHLPHPDYEEDQYNFQGNFNFI